MTTCFSDDQIRQFLVDGLPHAEDEAVEAHAETCPACRERLARLSNEATGIDLDRLSSTARSNVSFADAAIMRRLRLNAPTKRH